MSRDLPDQFDSREDGPIPLARAVMDAIVMTAGTLTGLASPFTVHIELWLAEMWRPVRRD